MRMAWSSGVAARRAGPRGRRRAYPCPTAPRSSSSVSARSSDFGSGFSSQGKPCDVVDARRLERQHHLGEIEPLHLGQFLRRAPRMLPLGPEPHAHARRGAAGAAGPLVGGSRADLLDQERVDAAVRIVTRHAGEAAVDDGRHAVDGERGFRDIGRDDDLARVVARHRAVLRLRRQLAVQRQDEEIAQRLLVLHRLHRPADLVGAGHEDQQVARRLRRHPRALARRDLPHRLAVEIDRPGQILDCDRETCGPAMRAPRRARGSPGARRRRAWPT